MARGVIPTAIAPVTFALSADPEVASGQARMSSVLLIEDDPFSSRLYATMLSRDGHQVATAATVDAAMTELAGSLPSVVVIDRNLDRDSASLHDALVRRGLRVLMVSGSDHENLESVAVERGWSFLAKPFSATALRAEISRLLSDRRSRPPGASDSTASGKSTPQIIAETVVDLFALAIMGTLLVLHRVQAEWLQALLVVGILLLCGVRVADLRALAKGLPTQGGVTALLLSGAVALARNFGDRT